MDTSSGATRHLPGCMGEQHTECAASPLKGKAKQCRLAGGIPLRLASRIPHTCYAYTRNCQLRICKAGMVACYRNLR